MFKLCGINVTPDQVAAIREEVEKDTNIENWVPTFIGLYENRLEENLKSWLALTNYQIPATSGKTLRDAMSKSTPVLPTKK